MASLHDIHRTTSPLPNTSVPNTYIYIYICVCVCVCVCVYVAIQFFIPQEHTDSLFCQSNLTAAKENPIDSV